MSYAATADIKNALPEGVLIELTDDEGLGEVSESRVSDAISGASAEIDAYCGGRYAVPFNPAPDLIKKLAVDIAIYNLYSRLTDSVPQTRAERYKAAIKHLEGVARGYITVGVESEAAQARSSGASTNVTSESQVFTRSKMEGF